MSAVFFAVDREHAKPMFAAREPTALLEFFHGFIPTDPPQLVMEDHWTVINEFLQQQGTSHEQWTMPLSMAFNGGRTLLDESERKVYLVRPDVVGFLGEILKELLDEGTPEDQLVFEGLTQMQDFYQQAAERRQCVVFTIGIL